MANRSACRWGDGYTKNGILTKACVQSETKPQSPESGHLLKGIMSRDISPCRSV
jgi:hypothetical protein